MTTTIEVRQAIGPDDAAARTTQALRDAFLIGESLLLAPDPAAKLRELTGGN